MQISEVKTLARQYRFIEQDGTIHTVTGYENNSNEGTTSGLEGRNHRDRMRFSIFIVIESAFLGYLGGGLWDIFISMSSNSFLNGLNGYFKIILSVVSVFFALQYLRKNRKTNYTRVDFYKYHSYLLKNIVKVVIAFYLFAYGAVLIIMLTVAKALYGHKIKL